MVSLDDLAKLDTSPAKTKLDEIKFEGDDVPEDLRGKTAADLLKLASGSRTLLSEKDQQLAEINAKLAQLQANPPGPVVEKQPDEVPDKTIEELNEMFQKDPLAAIAEMTSAAERRVAKNVELRLGTLVTGSMANIEAAARAKYPDEFALFGEQIEAVKKATVKDKSLLADPAVWDDMISFVRGKPANFEKLVEHRLKKNGKGADDEAHKQQVALSGPATTTTQRTPALKQPAGGTLTEEQKHAADVLGMTHEDYLKWMRVE
jgi:hypothetical protein